MTIYKNILKKIDYPTDVIVLDFETYYDSKYSLGKLSPIEYITDDRFEILGLGSKYNDRAGMFIHEPKISDFKKDECTFIVKNAKFDMLILKEVFGIEPEYIIDVEDLTRMFDAKMRQSLKKVAPLFELGDKGDTSYFKGLHWDDMSSEMKQALDKYCKWDIELEYELFKKILPIVDPSREELDLARHTLGLYLNPSFKVDIPGAYKLMGAMSWEKQLAAKRSGYTEKQLRSNKGIIDMINKVLPDGQTCPMKAGKNGQIPALAKNDQGTRDLLNHPKEEVRNLIEARSAVKSWPLHIKRVQKLINQAECRGGFLGVPLKYHGGHTGRWSGTHKINLQNLGGGQAHELIRKMRGLLYAPEGKKLIIVDSSQIEARVLAWYAGQKNLLSDFAANRDVYSVFATEVFGGRVRKPRKGDPDAIKELLTIRRAFGKQAILGAGYGMGSSTFYERCRQDDNLRELIDSGKYDFAFIDRLIKTYRDTYSGITIFWKQLENGFRWSVENPDRVTEFKNGLKFYNDDYGTVHIVLPSGRHLRYRHASMKRVKNYKQPQLRYLHKSKGLWGGHFAENVVQATSRDLLGFWILEQEKAGIHVVHHAHDETVAMVEGDKADDKLEEVIEIFKRKPSWAKDLPLNAEGKVSDVYTK